jgi:hypothetical protein
MYMNLMQLIKEAKPGTFLKSRGGQRYTYDKFSFVKEKKNTVKVYTGHTWNVIEDLVKEHLTESVICTLTPEGVTFKLPKVDKGKRYNNNHHVTWNMGSFFSLGLLYGCYTRHSMGLTLVQCNIKKKNATVVPHGVMKFDWEGNLISEIPKRAIKQYNTWYKGVKATRNAQSRARYAQQKAEREFKKYDKAGELDKYPIANVFLIQNAQLRSYAMNAIGLEKVLAPYPVKVVNTETIEGQGKYELVDIQLPSISIYQFGRRTKSQPKWCLYLKMTNQSTGEYHLEGVPRKSDSWNSYIPEETVRGALAWRDGEEPERGHGFDSGKEKVSQWKYIEPVILT